MKHNYLKFGLLLSGLFMLTAGTWSQAVTTFDYTGDVQTYVVPDGITSVQIDMFGAEGGTCTNDSTSCGDIGGLGGSATGILTVTPGETLYIYVGGRGYSGNNGGYNGGGLACSNTSTCATGGGASDVRQGGTDFADRVIVAGGGGGAEYSACNGTAGAGGGLVGGDGSESGVANIRNGDGGTQVTGGTGGDGGYDGGTGMFGVGGASGTHPAGHAGSGGGGWYGGGGSSEDGHAGGGSSYIDGLEEASTESGVRSGHGEVTITELCVALTVTVSDDLICFGDSFTLDAEGDGEITWDGGVTNGEPFTPDETGVTTYTATSDDEGECPFTVDIEVLELPEVTGSVDADEICEGESITLTGDGADEFEWMPGDIEDGLAFEPEAGEYVYVVTGTDDETGCENSAELEVTVFALPEVEAIINDAEICLGESVVLNGEGAETYTWDPAESDGVAFTPVAIGTTTYSVVGVDANGCENEATVDLTVYETLEITFSMTEEVMGDDGAIDITVTGGNPAYVFDWDNDGTGDFDDPEDLSGISGGTYTVEVNCDAGCEVTQVINLGSQVGISELNADLITVYPNPTTDLVTINFNGKFTYELTNIAGDILLKGFGQSNEELSLKEFADGVYLLKVNTAQGLITLKVIKK